MIVRLALEHILPGMRSSTRLGCFYTEPVHTGKCYGIH